MKIRNHSLTPNTFIQAVVLGLIGGPMLWIFGFGGGSLAWCCGGMFFAPILVDALKPTIILE